MEVTQSIKLNINATGNYCVVTVKQGDTGRKLNVTMCDGQTELFIPSSATVSVRVLKADGTSVDDAATVENGKAIVELTEQMTAVAGIAKADVSVASDGKIVSTATFLLKIGAVPMGVEIVSENEFTQLSTLIASASQYESRIEDLEAAVAGGAGGLSNEAKQALLDCFEHVAWVDEHGQDYVDALQVALYPPADLVGISAVYTQSGTVYDTDSLDDLKDDLVVTAHYSDSTTETVTTYTLSGTLVEGTSTITVAYGGKTTTFTVTVNHQATSDMNGWTDGVAYTNLTIVENEYVAKGSGAIISYTGWNRTGYVPCDGASSITFPPLPETGGSAQSNAFYSANHDVVEKGVSLSRTETVTINVPATATYFIISSDASALTSCINAGIVPNA